MYKHGNSGECLFSVIKIMITRNQGEENTPWCVIGCHNQLICRSVQNRSNRKLGATVIQLSEYRLLICVNNQCAKWLDLNTSTCNVSLPDLDQIQNQSSSARGSKKVTRQVNKIFQGLKCYCFYFLVKHPLAQLQCTRSPRLYLFKRPYLKLKTD